MLYFIHFHHFLPYSTLPTPPTSSTVSISVTLASYILLLTNDGSLELPVWFMVTFGSGEAAVYNSLEFSPTCFYCIRWIQWQIIFVIKQARTCHLLCKRPGFYHNISKTHVRDRILNWANSCFSELSESLNSLNSMKLLLHLGEIPLAHIQKYHSRVDLS